MGDSLLLGIWRHMVPVPSTLWRRQVRGDADLSFMSEEHHRIRDFVVVEIPRRKAPISADIIARELDLPLEQVTAILDELERNMTFLFRDERGAVTWAYPVTAEPTPHRMSFSTGEQIYAA
jgi:hypothetical protein